MHHAGQAYGDGGGWPYTPSNPAEFMPWIWHFFSTNAAFFMGLYFLISGYFVPRSFDKQGAKQFVHKKLLRLGIPLLFMGGIICVLTGKPFITEGRFFCYRAMITKEPSPCMFRSPKCESITEDRIESNLSKTKNIPPKAVIFSDFICTFAMSLMILLVLICSTKVSEKSDMAKS